MQMQSAHNNKSENHMIRILVYIILLDKNSELHTEPLWTEQNISRCMEVLSPRKSPLCIVEVLPIPLSKCPGRNQNIMFPKESKQNVPKGTRTEFECWPATPYSPILFKQYTTYFYAYIYPESLIKSHIQKFYRIT